MKKGSKKMAKSEDKSDETDENMSEKDRILAIRAERKKLKERQRREDVHRLFEDLSKTLSDVERDQIASMERQDSEMHDGGNKYTRGNFYQNLYNASHTSTNTLSRADIIARTVTFLQEMSTEMMELRIRNTEMAKELNGLSGPKKKPRLSHDAGYDNLPSRTSDLYPKSDKGVNMYDSSASSTSRDPRLHRDRGQQAQDPQDRISASMNGGQFAMMYQMMLPVMNPRTQNNPVELRMSGNDNNMNFGHFQASLGRHGGSHVPSESIRSSQWSSMYGSSNGDDNRRFDHKNLNEPQTRFFNTKISPPLLVGSKNLPSSNINSNSSRDNRWQYSDYEQQRNSDERKDSSSTSQMSSHRTMSNNKSDVSSFSKGRQADEQELPNNSTQGFSASNRSSNSPFDYEDIFK